MKRRAPNANNVWPNLKERLALVPIEPGTSTIFTTFACESRKLASEFKAQKRLELLTWSCRVFNVLWLNQRYDEDRDHDGEERRIKRTIWWEFLVRTFVCKSYEWWKREDCSCWGELWSVFIRQSRVNVGANTFYSFLPSFPNPLPLFYSSFLW